jgi:hypothetical protein
VLNDVEVAIEVVEVIVVVETVVVEVNDVEMEVEVTPPTITMLVKPTSLAGVPVTFTVYVPKSEKAEGTVNDPTIPPLPGPVIEQEVAGGMMGVGVFTVIAQLVSAGLKPEPLTLTKNAGPTDVGETETVGEVTVKV